MVNIIGEYNRSVILTYIGLATAAGGIFLSIQGHAKWAFIALIAAGICDLFDGSLARKVKRNDEQKEFGVQIDSLADIVSFGVFPVVLMYTIGLQQWYHILILVFYLLCAVIRLAYFNVHHTKSGYYTGLPVTYSSLALTLIYSVSLLVGEVEGILFTMAMGILALLYIADVKVKKPGGSWYAVFAAMAAGFTVFILFKG